MNDLYFRMSANYYVSRDPRREVAQPVSLSQKLIGGDGTKRLVKNKYRNTRASTNGSLNNFRTKLPTPGTLFKWD